MTAAQKKRQNDSVEFTRTYSSQHGISYFEANKSEDRKMKYKEYKKQQQQKEKWMECSHYNKEMIITNEVGLFGCNETTSIQQFSSATAAFTRSRTSHGINFLVYQNKSIPTKACIHFIYFNILRQKLASLPTSADDE